MKKFFVFIAAIMLMGGVLLLTGCGRDGNLVGTWVFDEDPAYSVTFERNGDGSQTSSSGYSRTFRWTTSGSELVWRYPTYAPLHTEYTVVGDVFTWTDTEGNLRRYTRAVGNAD